MEKNKVHFYFFDEKFTLLVNEGDEKYYSEARDIFKAKLAELNTKYGVFGQGKELVTILAIEALVDGLILREYYQKLQLEVDNKLKYIKTSIKV
mgnify:CR=1 FL=1